MKLMLMHESFGNRKEEKKNICDFLDVGALGQLLIFILKYLQGRVPNLVEATS